MSGMYWSTHPFSKRLRKQAESDAALAMETLRNKAKVSSDPEVKSAWSHLNDSETWLKRLEAIENEERKRESDE